MNIKIIGYHGSTLYNGPSNRLKGKSLVGAQLLYHDLQDIDLTGCDFTGSNFHGANCRDSIFVNANLTNCSFNHAQVDGADFTNATVSETESNIPKGWKFASGHLRRILENECNSCDETGDLNECGACYECCDHFHCVNCSSCTDTSDVCGHCDCCEDCCNCTLCGDCAQLEECTSCNMCDHHCTCDDDDELDDPGHAWKFEPTSKFKCKRSVGIEWEFNNRTNLREWQDKWRGGMHEDGSCGYEAVTAPLAGDHIASCLQDLGKALSKTEADDRCGIHVHVDARDLNWSDMYRLLWVYGKVEPFLYLLAGQHRAKVDYDQTSYCKPVGKEYLASLSEVDRKGAVLAVALGKGDSEKAARRTLRQRRLGKKDGGRYRGLNIIPWLVGRAYKERQVKKDLKTGKITNTFTPKSDSTVEFRMHRNTLLADRVVGWAQLCACLVDWSARATDKEAQNLPKSALRALCEIIAPECKTWILHRLREWRKATAFSRRNKVPRRISLTAQGYRLKVGK